MSTSDQTHLKIFAGRANQHLGQIMCDYMS